MAYFNFVLQELSKTTDQVLIYEYATCIHEMLKEIDYWIKISGQSNSKVTPFSVSKPRELFEFGDP